MWWWWVVEMSQGSLRCLQTLMSSNDLGGGSRGLQCLAALKVSIGL